MTVTWPFKVPGICMELQAGTRVCALRVDTAASLASVVLPKLVKLVPRFAEDGIMLFNTGWVLLAVWAALSGCGRVWAAEGGVGSSSEGGASQGARRCL